MKKIILSILTFLICFNSKSQKETDKWYFGNGVGLDFSTGTASVIAGGAAAYAPSEGCSVISDGAGNLLFYTDGITVFNKNHLQMANGSGLMGGNSSTQAALIVLQPGSNGIYYIFTTDDFGGANGLRYSIVDMNLAASMGSVTVKNSLLMTPMTEKVAAVKDPFNNRVWIAAHQWGNNSFNAYSLTASGLSAPVITNIGTSHTGTLQNTYGQMKFNPCGNQCALTIGYTDIWELFDFNTNTGVFSKCVTFPQTAHVYGIEFSADASKIYVSTYDVIKTLVQYNLSVSTNTNVIAASEFTLSATPSIYGLQLANDGKIYVCKSFSQYIGVVNTPSVAGAGCNYNDLQVDVDPSFMGTTAALSLPGFPSSYFLPTGFVCPTPTGVNEISVQNLMPVIYPNPSAHHFSILTQASTKIEVYSYTGKLVETLVSEKSETLVFGENYAKGIYFIKTTSGEKTASTKVVKQ